MPKRLRLKAPSRAPGLVLLITLLFTLGACASPAAVSERSRQQPDQPTPPASTPAAASIPLNTGRLVSDGSLGARTSGSWTVVPILLYHYIRVNPNPKDRLGFGLSVTPGDFHLQMLYLASHGFNVISLHLAVQAINEQRALPPRPVVLTFDDGYRDFYQAAAPELVRYGFTATNFVITGFVGRGSYLTWPQIEALDRAGFTMADHTVDHRPLADLPAARALWEMRQARQTLEGQLGHPVIDLAYPFGSFSPTVAAQAGQLGFECAVSTLPGTAHRPQELMELARLRVEGGDSLSYFADLVGGPAPTAEWVRWARAGGDVVVSRRVGRFE
jgi:peptidoglycan/xylan/chitin deacetylase (PgdA/CDA1 family)